ncbi:MAG: glycosyltransferase family 4 protein [Cytophagales bacterium]|nr:glycosyltransferase family 4 protein [Cytophagales bacterium]
MQQKIKICFVAARANHSGAARSLWQLVKYIDKSRFDCSVIVNEYGAGIAKLQPYAPCYFFLPKKYRIRYTYRLRMFLAQLLERRWFLRKLRQLDPDVIYFNTNASIRYMQWAKTTGKPIVCHVHGEREGLVFRYMNQNGMVPLAPEWQRTTRQVPDHFIACACASKRVLTGHLGISANRITVAHESIDLAEIRAYGGRITKEEVSGWAGKTILGVNAGVNYRKGVDVLIRAIGLLNGTPAAEDCLFVWFGEEQDPAYWQYCQQLMAECNVEEKLRFMGQEPDIYKYLKLLDVFVLPSRDECLPLSMLEAMAVGKPVVVTAVSGIPEAVNDQNGILVSPDDPQALADGMLLALRHLRQGDAARVERAYAEVARFDAQPQAKKIEKALIDLLARRGEGETAGPASHS